MQPGKPQRRKFPGFSDSLQEGMCHIVRQEATLDEAVPLTGGSGYLFRDCPV